MGGIKEIMGTDKERERAKKECTIGFLDHGDRLSAEGFSPEICEEIIGVPALLGPDDLCVLFAHAQKIPNGGTYLEIGCARGGSLRCAYLGAKSVGKHINLIGIDPDPGADFKENTKDLPNFTFYQMKSDKATGYVPNDSIDLVFVDGDHSREWTCRDVLNYWKKLKPGGGIMLGDNWNEEGVKLGVIDAVQDNFDLPKASNFFRIRK